ncbi:MAG: Do family serine endopeptidase [Cytophagales bacterium]|nr:Do family serine endopeptidase [Cytophagales bacterium]
MKNYIVTGMIALVISLGVVWLAPDLIRSDQTIKIEHVNGTPAQGAVYTVNSENEIVPLNFTEVAADVMDAVVHIRSTQTSSLTQQRQYQQSPHPFRDFFGDDFFNDFFGQPGPNRRYEYRSQPQPRVGTGSGVIINESGYIVTNNHVIADADDIEVTLHDNRTYKASVIGTDPSTDLALIQIQETGLKSVPFVNSDQVQVGEWVLAVGNPFNLNSTVTAGIVSAKSRNINILRDQYAVESFIQTDAAINPGNSGGALVNLQGGLVGINTAIASPTGAYSGYGFAVPANMVNKVVEDLLKYGAVQRGYLGITIRSVDGNLAKEKDLDVTKGVYVDSLAENSAGMDAGLASGDVIIAVEGIEVASAPELQEMIARHRPGDEVALKVARGNKELELKAKLKNREGETRFLAKNRDEVLNMLGAEFEDLDKKTARDLGLSGGVRVKKLFPGKLRRETSMREGFIITKVDRQVIRDQKDLARVLQRKEGGVLIEGYDPDRKTRQFYAFGL